jgi:hypothetical protein
MSNWLLAEHKFRRLPRASIGSTSHFVESKSCSYNRYRRYFSLGLTYLAWLAKPSSYIAVPVLILPKSIGYAIDDEF